MQARLDGVTPQLWYEEDYVVSESVPIGRIYKVPMDKPEAGRWVWYIDSRGIREEIPTHGITESLEEAKQRFAASWEAALRQRRG